MARPFGRPLGGASASTCEAGRSQVAVRAGPILNGAMTNEQCARSIRVTSHMTAVAGDARLQIPWCSDIRSILHPIDKFNRQCRGIQDGVQAGWSVSNNTSTRRELR